MQNNPLIETINQLKKNKNAVILAHYYQNGEIQEIADFVGDSLDLSRMSSDTDADIIVFAGVHFMAETAKILSPTKMVLIPDPEAGCSLADSCSYNDFKSFIENHPNHVVVSYVNTTAEIKTLTDITCTSTNAKQVIDSIPKDKEIIFAPDRNLGNYLNGITGRNMVLWDGACHVHEEFSLEKMLAIKEQYPKAKIIAHPECQTPIQIAADFIGSTSALLGFTETDESDEFIVATESGILHQMRKRNPGKQFFPAPPIDSTCGCNDCKYMKLNTLRKIHDSLLYEQHKVELNAELIKKARLPIQRMLEISNPPINT